MDRGIYWMDVLNVMDGWMNVLYVMFWMSAWMDALDGWIHVLDVIDGCVGWIR